MKEQTAWTPSSGGCKIVHVTTIDRSLRYLLMNQLLSIKSDGFFVYGASAPGGEVAFMEQAGIPHLSVPFTRRMAPLRDLAAFLVFFRICRRHRFTIVHTHTPKPSLIGQLAARLAGVPIVVNTVHGFYFHEYTPLIPRTAYILIERIAGMCSDLVLSQNSEDINTAIALKIASPRKLFYLGNGIDLTRFNPQTVSREQITQKRAELGIPQTSRVIGYVGRLVREKGVLELLEAAAVVRRSVPDLRLLLIGRVDTDKKDALRPEVARAFGVEDICIFPGLRNDMSELYRTMDVFALPSYREGFPRALMEATAMGIPSVATDIRGCREVVVPEKTGLLVKRKDVASLAQALIRVLSDEALAGQLGRAAEALARREFDEQVVFERVKSHYHRLLKEKGYLESFGSINESQPLLHGASLRPVAAGSSSVQR